MSNPLPSAVLTERFAHAFAFASVVHASQVRKGTRIPYLSHLMGVASLVLEHGADADTAIAALLHDAPEHRGGYAMLAQIKARFGDRVEKIVEGCTDTFEDPKPKWVQRHAVDEIAAHKGGEDLRAGVERGRRGEPCPPDSGRSKRHR